MHFNQLQKIAHSIGQPRILVVGDLILDKYIWGGVGRISPEAPIQVLEVDREELRLGGAGNVMHNLACLGARVSCVGVVGEDEGGETLKRKLGELGLKTRGIFSSPDRPTTLKTRFLAQNQQVLRVDNESKKGIPQEVQLKIAQYLEEHLEEYDLVVISDYAKGVLTNEVLANLIDRCREMSIPTLVDPKGKHYRRYRGATIITPNKTEIELASGFHIGSGDSLVRAARWMLSELDLQAAIITLGKEGIYLYRRDGRGEKFSARARNVYDVTGAGDTVIAALAICVAGKIDYSDAVQFANCAAALVVEKLGTVSVTIEEILDRAPDSHQSVPAKILTVDEAVKTARDLRDQGRSIVFTNGCFDLLHPGHVQLLTFAKNLGSYLIVGINSDQSITDLKGPARPFLSADARATVLAALECVDYVTIFDRPTPLELIESIEPDILVKGGDFKNDIVVGREFVEGRGGRVELAPLLEGFSTSKIAAEISRRLSGVESSRPD